MKVEGHHDAAELRLRRPDLSTMTRAGRVLIASVIIIAAPACSHTSPATPTLRVQVTTLAGDGVAGFKDGPATEAEFNDPISVATGQDGGVYVADGLNYRIREIMLGGVVRTVAGNGTRGIVDGSGGPDGTAELAGPSGVAVDSSGNCYVSDSGFVSGDFVIRKIDPSGALSAFAGNPAGGFADGSASTALFGEPNLLAMAPGNRLLVADFGNSSVRAVSLASGYTSTLAGNGSPGWVDGTGGISGTAEFDLAAAVASDSSGDVYVCDLENSAIREISPDGHTTTLAGNGRSGYADGSGGRSGTAEFKAPAGVAVGPDGYVYVADADDNRVRRIAPDGTTSTLAGNGTAGFADGDGDSAEFHAPYGLAFDRSGNLYVADQRNNRIRKIIFLPSQ